MKRLYRYHMDMQKCGYFQTPFHNAEQFKEHHRKEDSKTKKPDICDKVFRTPKDLNRDMMMDNNVRTFQCTTNDCRCDIILWQLNMLIVVETNRSFGSVWLNGFADKVLWKFTSALLSYRRDQSCIDTNIGPGDKF